MNEANEYVLMLLASGDIGRAARRWVREYTQIETDDIEQELCVFVLSNHESIAKSESALMADTAEAEQPRRLDGFRRMILDRAAERYCGREASKHSAAVAAYYYRPSDVRRMLDNALDDDSRLRTWVPEDARSTHVGPPHAAVTTEAAASEDEDWYGTTPDYPEYESIDLVEVTTNTTPMANMDSLIVSMDVRMGMERLRPEDRNALYRRFVKGEVGDSAERNRLSRAIDRLTAAMNQYRAGRFDD